VAGTLTGRGGAIYNIGLDVFPRDANGLVLGWLIDTDLETLNPGAVFDFATTGVPTSFAAYRVFTNFIDGPKPPSARVAWSTADARATAVASARDKRATLRARLEEIRARRTRAGGAP
jgi:hypothetical protein